MKTDIATVQVGSDIFAYLYKASRNTTKKVLDFFKYSNIDQGGKITREQKTPFVGSDDNERYISLANYNDQFLFMAVGYCIRWPDTINKVCMYDISNDSWSECPDRWQNGDA